MRKLYILLLTLVTVGSMQAQDFSNAGKEFWIPYSYHQQMSGGGGGIAMTLYITTESNTTYNVEIFGSPVVPISTGAIAAGQVITVNIPNTYFINNDGLFTNKAVRVTSQKNVVVYSFITFSAVSAATLCLPSNILGTDYYSMNFTQRSNVGNANSYFTIIATEDNTSVEIIPSAATKGGWAANSSNTVTLNKGEIYQVLGTTTGNNGTDLTGSIIRSISVGTNGCKKIAVFSGSGRVVIGSSNCGSSSDNLYQQLYPATTWGKRFVTVPSFSRPSNFYRISKINVAAVVKLNGIVIPNASFVNNFYHEFQNSTVNVIESTEPICVAQYFTSQNCDGNAAPYDPEMIILNPIEQNISKVTLVNAALVANQPPAHQHHIHVIAPNTGSALSSFMFDGNTYTGTWTQVPGLPNYSYTYLNGVSQGFHRLVSDSGFNALAYGYGGAESYGYSAGANVKDLFQFVSVQNPLGTVNFPSACKGTPFFLYQTLPYKPLSITWDFSASGLPNPPFSNYTSTNPTSIIQDSTFVDNRWIYRFKNPNNYIINTTGIYPITVQVNNPTGGGCSGLQEIDYDLEVFGAPTANFDWVHNGCVTDTVRFRENSTLTDNRPVIKWRWTFHDNTVDSVKFPLKKYNTGGSFPVKLQVVTDVGCLSDTLPKTIVISDTAVCSIAVTSGATCAGVPITVSPTCGGTVGGTGVGAGGTGIGTIVQWIWIWGDGSPNDTLTAGTPATHTYTNAGNYTIIIKTVTGSGCASIAPLNIVVGSSSPVSFTLPANVCLPVGAATFTNTSNGGTPIGTYTWNFGDGSPTQTAINGTHNYTAVGPYTVTLSNVNAVGCSNTMSQSFNNIRPRPTATFTVAPEVCVKDSIQCTSTAVGNGGNIVSYNWAFSDGTTSTLQNPKKKWATPGPKSIQHWVVTNQGCTSDTATTNIVVNASPMASFTFPTTGRCANVAIAFTNTSTSTDGTVLNGTWEWGDGSPAQNVAGTATTNHTFALAGTYQVKLIVTSSKGCVADTFTSPITITASPVASFIPPGGICLPSGFAQFTNNTTISDGTLPTVTYLWNFGDASPNSTATSPSHIYAGTGPYTVTLTATSAIGCVDDSVQVVSNIYARPQASFTGGAEVCINSPITYTSTSNPINGTVAEHYWDNGSGTFVLGTNTVTVTPSTTTPLTIRHYIKTSNGCISDTATKPLTVNQLPTASFTYSALNCERDSITFTSTSVPNNGVLVEYTWDWADGSALQIVNSNAPIKHLFATANTYQVKLTVKSDKDCVSTATTNLVVVHPKPVTNFTLPANVCLPVGAATFTNTTTIANATLPQVTYTWNFGDGSPTTTTLNGVHNYTAVGPFTVKLEATSNQGCKHDTSKIFDNIRPRPTAGITGNPEVCLSDSIQLTSTSVGNGGTIVTYNWDFGDGTTSTLPNPKKRWATSGPKTVRHWITTDQGCMSDTATKPVIVNALPIANFTASTPQCENKNITFTNISTSADGIINTWTWDFGDGSPTVTGVGPHIYTYATTGTYTATLNVTTSKGCSNANAASAQVIISPNPVVKMYLPEICLNDPTAQFRDSSSIADGTESQFTYLWNFGDPNATGANPNTSTLKNPTHQYSQAANYNMWLEVTSGKGCKSRKDTVFTVNGATPVASFTVQNANNLCSNKQVTIQNTSTVNFGSLTYLEVYWDWANNPTVKTIDNTPTPNKLYSYIYPAFGTPPTKTYVVRIVAYSGAITGPCVATFTQNITVLGSPKVTFGTIPDVCQEVPTVSLTQAQETTTIAGIGTFTGNGISGNIFNPSLAGIGTHVIKYTFVATNGCLDSASSSITVNPTPNANAGPDRTVLEGGTSTLLGSSTSSNVTYLWTPSTYLSSTTIPQPVTAAINDIDYTLTVTSDKNCKASDIVKVRVLKGPRVPNAFSPNGDGINDTWEIEFLDTYIGCTVEIFNIYGEKVYRNVGYAKPWNGTYNGKPLPIGTYYYIIEPKNGRAALTGYVGIVR